MKGVIHENGKFRLCQDHDFSFLSKNAITGVNYAKMGATVKTGFAIMQRKLGLCTQDDTVLLSFGGNDCDYDWAQIAARPDDEHLPAVPPEAFCAGYRTLIETAQQSGARVAVASIIPLEAERYMQCISTGKNADHILKWLGDVNHLYRWQEYYNTMLACAIARLPDCRSARRVFAARGFPDAHQRRRHSSLAKRSRSDSPARRRRSNRNVAHLSAAAPAPRQAPQGVPDK